MSILSLKNVNVAYNSQQWILQNCELDIKMEEKIAIIGANGAGKSTIGKAIMGMMPYCEGEIKWLGKEIQKVAIHQRLSLGIGYFMQGGRVFSHLSSKENLEVVSSHLPKKEQITQLERIISHFSLFQNKERINLQAGNLSGGEKHQLSLAMVIAANSTLQLLIADEPSAGLSPINVGQMYQLLEHLQADLGFSLLLIEQNVARAKQYCEKVYVLKEGRLHLQKY